MAAKTKKVGPKGATASSRPPAKPSLKSAAERAAELEEDTLAAAEDLTVQRATNAGQISYLSAALFTGHHPPRSLTENLRYGESPFSNEAVRKLLKAASSYGLPTAIARCREAGSIVPMDMFINRLCDSLSCAVDDYASYAATAAANIQLWYAKVKSVASTEAAVVAYVEEYILHAFPGRGLPQRLATDLLLQCERLSGASLSTATSQWGGQKTLAQPNLGGSSASSAGGGQAPGWASSMRDDLKAMGEQLKEAVGGVSRLNNQFGSMESRMSKMENRAGNLESRPWYTRTPLKKQVRTHTLCKSSQFL